MKLQPDKSSSTIINAHGLGWIQINGTRFQSSLVVSSIPGSPPSPWGPCLFENLKASDFDALVGLGAELIIFGSGHQLRFAKPQWIQTLIGHGIGVETMDSAAACRTYNILASEGRKVIAAILIES
ncbi:MAG: hypothetical protein HEQ17_06500 [Limnohabitans sp.]|jgi:uncharacterized protein|uniref:Mth938-like domain-containing protein n=1 Tax=Limnohabitans sp. TaxID=1907725 RepID=UPI0025FE8747|nr:MTH938/NDUFAF3 family protein [Limnohabitans sp.]MCO4088599.1 hypothetical protein [Limnohabitans sp.]